MWSDALRVSVRGAAIAGAVLVVLHPRSHIWGAWFATWFGRALVEVQALTLAVAETIAYDRGVFLLGWMAACFGVLLVRVRRSDRW